MALYLVNLCHIRNIKLDIKVSPVTNTLAYLSRLSGQKEKEKRLFLTMTTGAIVIKQNYVVIYCHFRLNYNSII
jgi:hypothetical protein